MSIVKDYLTLTEQWVRERGENIIVLYQNGSFFEMWGLQDPIGNIIGSRISDVANHCDLKLAVTNKHSPIQANKNHKVLMAGFKVELINKYLKKLYELGFTAIVYEQESDGKGFIRKLTQIVSPGTYWSNETDVLSNNTTCVWINHTPAFGKHIEKIIIGLSNIDIFTGKTSLFEVTNAYMHDPATYDELERFISIYNPSEIIIIHNLTDDIVNDIIKFTNIQSTSIIKVDVTDTPSLNKETEFFKMAEKCEKQTYQSEIINSFFDNINDEIFFENYQHYTIATQSFCFLLDFVKRHNPNLVNKITTPIFENCSDRLVLANHSLSQLNIINDNRYKGKLSSVSSFLNNCVTNMGKRKFYYDLLNPIKDETILNSYYNITEHLLSNTCNSWEDYRKGLYNTRDIEKLIRKLIIKKITPKDVSILSQNINNIISLNKKIIKDKILYEYLDKPTINIDCKDICEMIDTNFDINKCENISEFTCDGLTGYSVEELCFVKKGVSEQIDKTIKEYYDSREQFESIRSYLSNAIQTLEKKNSDTQFIKIHETAKSDDLLIGTSRRITLLKSALPKTDKINIEYTSTYTKTKETFSFNLSELEYKPHGSNKSNLIVTSLEIRHLTSNIQNVKEQLIKYIISYYNSFIDRLIEKRDELNNISEYITIIDTLQCRCYIANKYNYCKPVIQKQEKAFINFEGLRHCLIEHILTKELYVTNELVVGNEFNGFLIYGTNAVGKTSLIRAIGISLVMAQAGLYVPCSSFVYSPYSYLFTRILGNDNLFKGQSTFAVEMSELRTILKMANSNSLILGDELCSGTEQGSANSIFTTGLEFLDKLNSSYIFATHFHEITQWTEIKDIEKLKLMHMSVLYDKETKKLIYDRKLKEGPGHTMYGLEVCKALKLPDEFLERAHQIRVKYNPESGNTTSMAPSHYNSKKIRGICEMCKSNIGEDVHHLQHQKKVNGKNNYINSFHKNHSANLINVCKNCHDEFHSTDVQFKRIKTSEGYDIVRC
jgi:DNA mismatch repair protein MutS